MRERGPPRTARNPPLAEPMTSKANGLAARLWPLTLLVIAMASMQFGAAYAKGLFPRVGAQGAAGLRLAFSALMLGLATRPWRGPRVARSLSPLLAYGAALGAMNTLFYMALATTPLGIAIALEFIGPLGLALAASRRPADFAWIALAVGGLLVLLPLRQGAHAVDPRGAAFALGSGACWALYIVFGRRAGALLGGRATGLGMIVAAAIFAPVAIARIGPALFAPGLIPAALLLALLSSALPYSLEMVALTRLPARVFGTLMSLEPGVGAIAGLVMLGERPTVEQWAGIAAVVVASVGTTLSARRPEA